MTQLAPGQRFRQALIEESPLQIVGTIHAYSAIMAERTGFRALYVSGAGVANASYGLPDLGITNLHDVLEDATRICEASMLPVLVDVDTGWGSAFNIARTVCKMEKAGVAAIHIEDQVHAKRCGHRPNKSIVSQEEMVDRIKAAVDARIDPSFVIMARTDALAKEGMQAAVDRSLACIAAGADMIFPEAVESLEQYAEFVKKVQAPVLANLTEFGKTPLFTRDELKKVGVAMALYPLSAFRAMNAAALEVYQTLRTEGTQKKMLPKMQTREELYHFLDYYAFERKLDELFQQELH